MHPFDSLCVCCFVLACFCFVLRDVCLRDVFFVLLVCDRPETISC